MYTVPIKLWVDKLLSKCARTDMTNTFLMPQTMSNSLTLQNNSLDLHEVPSQDISDINAAADAFAAYPAGTKFECVVASTAVRDNTGGPYTYRSIYKGAFKLKSLGIGGGGGFPGWAGGPCYKCVVHVPS